MITKYFVVEEKNDEFILRFLLPKELLKDTRIIVAGGYSAALSATQSLFSLTPLPISLFFDTDTYSEKKIAENKQFIHSYLKKSFSNSFLLFPMKPTMEILFFYKKELLEKLIKSSMSDELWYQGKYEPKRVLIELAGNNKFLPFLRQNLTPEIIQELQKNPLIIDIVEKHCDSFVANHAIAA